MRPTSALAVAALCFALLIDAATPSLADVRILASPGGEVGSFIRLFAVLRESGERIVIDGPCLSACTLVLSTIPEERICVTRRAVLGFHGQNWSIAKAMNTWSRAPSMRRSPESIQRRCSSGSHAAAA
jgi:hypothetical protein